MTKTTQNPQLLRGIKAFFIAYSLWCLWQAPDYFEDGTFVYGISSVILWASFLVYYTYAFITGRDTVAKPVAFIWALSLAVMFFALAVPNVPGLRSAKLPFPDVRLSASATQVPTVNDYEPAAGHTFILIEATVRGVYGYRGGAVDDYQFDLKAQGKRYSDTYVGRLPDLCDDTPLPVGGSATCKLVFELPDTLQEAELIYNSLAGYDRTSVKF